MSDMIVFDMKDESSKMYGLPVEDGVVIGLIKFHRAVSIGRDMMVGIISYHHESKTSDYGAAHCDFFKYCQVGRNRNVNVEDLAEDASEDEIKQFMLAFDNGEWPVRKGCCG